MLQITCPTPTDILPPFQISGFRLISQGLIVHSKQISSLGTDSQCLSSLCYTISFYPTHMKKKGPERYELPRPALFLNLQSELLQLAPEKGICLLTFRMGAEQASLSICSFEMTWRLTQEFRYLVFAKFNDLLPVRSFRFNKTICSD